MSEEVKVFKSFREYSKKDFGRTVAEDDNLSNSDLHLGAVLRMADSLEIIAKNHKQMEQDRDFYKKQYIDASDEIYHLKKRCAGLKSRITRMKR